MIFMVSSLLLRSVSESTSDPQTEHNMFIGAEQTSRINTSIVFKTNYSFYKNLVIKKISKSKSVRPYIYACLKKVQLDRTPDVLLQPIASHRIGTQLKKGQAPSRASPRRRVPDGSRERTRNSRPERWRSVGPVVVLARRINKDRPNPSHSFRPT
jgi:hypothetical protein